METDNTFQVSSRVCKFKRRRPAETETQRGNMVRIDQITCSPEEGFLTCQGTLPHETFTFKLSRQFAGSCDSVEVVKCFAGDPKLKFT